MRARVRESAINDKTLAGGEGVLSIRWPAALLRMLTTVTARSKISVCFVFFLGASD